MLWQGVLATYYYNSTIMLVHITVQLSIWKSHHTSQEVLILGQLQFRQAQGQSSWPLGVPYTWSNTWRENYIISVREPWTEQSSVRSKIGR